MGWIKIIGSLAKILSNRPRKSFTRKMCCHQNSNFFSLVCFLQECRTSSHCIFKIMNHQRISKYFLILLSGLARYSQEHKLKIIFEILQVLFEKVPVFYSDWPNSWIWRILGHVRDIFCKCHLHNASKEVFLPKHFLNSMHRFKSATLPELKNCQNNKMRKCLFFDGSLLWSYSVS